MQNLNNLKNKKIFISGGAGIIGKQLVTKLLQLNAILLIGDKKKCPNLFKNKVKYIKKDLNLLKSNDLKKFKPEIFIHLAATYERTIENEDFFKNNFHNNVMLSNHLLEIVSKIKSIKKIIFASSYLIYSKDLYIKSKNNKAIKLKETAKIFPRNLVGAAKLYHENELRFLSNFRPKINITSARIFRGYGLGSRDIISRWIRSIIRNKTIKIYGANSSFDYIYCKDTAESLINILKLKHQFKIINVGYGKSSKIKDVLNVLGANFKKIKKKTNNQKTKIEKSYADMSYLIKKTNFRPKFSIDKGINEIIEYEKKNKR